uniref:Uncharacterized protein n=1 Tax=Chrysotila carterae TaxID=13221 RepID=A0A7S4F4S8_CHRCT
MQSPPRSSELAARPLNGRSSSRLRTHLHWRRAMFFRGVARGTSAAARPAEEHSVGKQDIQELLTATVRVTNVALAQHCNTEVLSGQYNSQKNTGAPSRADEMPLNFGGACNAVCLNRHTPSVDGIQRTPQLEIDIAGSMFKSIQVTMNAGSPAENRCIGVPAPRSQNRTFTPLSRPSSGPHVRDLGAYPVECSGRDPGCDPLSLSTSSYGCLPPSASLAHRTRMPRPSSASMLIAAKGTSFNARQRPQSSKTRREQHGAASCTQCLFASPYVVNSSSAASESAHRHAACAAVPPAPAAFAPPAAATPFAAHMHRAAASPGHSDGRFRQGPTEVAPIAPCCGAEDARGEWSRARAAPSDTTGVAAAAKADKQARLPSATATAAATTTAATAATSMCGSTPRTPRKAESCGQQQLRLRREALLRREASPEELLVVPTDEVPPTRIPHGVRLRARLPQGAPRPPTDRFESARVGDGWEVTVFPMRKPAGALDVALLEQWVDEMLQQRAWPERLPTADLARSEADLALNEAEQERASESGQESRGKAGQASMGVAEGGVAGSTAEETSMSEYSADGVLRASAAVSRPDAAVVDGVGADGDGVGLEGVTAAQCSTDRADRQAAAAPSKAPSGGMQRRAEDGNHATGHVRGGDDGLGVEERRAIGERERARAFGSGETGRFCNGALGDSNGSGGGGGGGSSAGSTGGAGGGTGGNASRAGSGSESSATMPRKDRSSSRQRNNESAPPASHASSSCAAENAVEPRAAMVLEVCGLALHEIGRASGAARSAAIERVWARVQRAHSESVRAAESAHAAARAEAEAAHAQLRTLKRELSILRWNATADADAVSGAGRAAAAAARAAATAEREMARRRAESNAVHQVVATAATLICREADNQKATPEMRLARIKKLAAELADATRVDEFAGE